MGFFTIDYTSRPKMSGIAPCEFPKPSAGTIHVEKCLSAEKFAFSSSDDIIMSQHNPESQNAGMMLGKQTIGPSCANWLISSRVRVGDMVIRSSPNRQQSLKKNC